MDKDDDAGEHHTLVGVIDHKEDEFGFAKVIDMDYKNKDDQFTKIMIYCWDIEMKQFKELCKELQIGIVEYVKQQG